jgi:hypothetical protein
LRRAKVRRSNEQSIECFAVSALRGMPKGREEDNPFADRVQLCDADFAIEIDAGLLCRDWRAR